MTEDKRKGDRYAATMVLLVTLMWLLALIALTADDVSKFTVLFVVSVSIWLTVITTKDVREWLKIRRTL